MEPPPAKRLRILQSVDVDEDNPDYVAAKQKQQHKFKGRLESIFAKFGDMHESMSDEIDMRDNTVVVDRGHLRRLERQVGRNQMMLLDTLGVTENHGHRFEQEEGSENSDDELAPLQLHEPRKRSFEDTEEAEQPALSPPATVANPISEPDAPPPDSPNPTANLLNLVQFPETPAGQQAQATFYTTLTQTINQAVQQAVAPLFSSLLPNKQTLSLQFTNALPTPGTFVQTDDWVAPATDPKWYFPPLSAEKSRFREFQSSPMAGLSNKETSNFVENRTKRIKPNLSARKKGRANPVLMEEASVTPVQSSTSFQDHLEFASDCGSPHYNPYKKRKGPGRKYDFTREDDIYISIKKGLHELSWAEVRAGRERWKNWPLTAFRLHWSKFLRKQNLHLKAAPITVEVQHSSTSSPCEQTTHLPTPSSLEQDESCKTAEDCDAECNDHENSSNVHFNEDERDLLSLADTDRESEHHHIGEIDEASSLALEDIVLPSVEAEEFIDEVTLQEGLVEDSPSVETTSVTQVIKIEPSISVPTSRQSQKFRPITFQAESDSETEDDIDMNFSMTADHIRQTTRRQSSRSIDLLSEDENETTTALCTKRELSTPPPTTMLFSTPAFQTSGSFTQHCSIHSSGSKSTSKLDRRTFLKQVKQSWTTRSSLGSKSSAKKQSFQCVPMKRACIADPESEDELA